MNIAASPPPPPFVLCGTGAHPTLRRSAGWNAAVLGALLATAALGSCDSGSPVDSQPTILTQGTWGGDNAGVIVGETIAHVHVGCTFGDFPAPISLDQDARFNVSGEYLLRAYPVAIGPTLPAQFAGIVRGSDLTLSIAVNDTINHKLVVLGPVTVKLKREPRMGPCPICKDRVPA